jgi:hypothetical protein
MVKTVSIYVVSINIAGLGNTYDKALVDDCSANASPLHETKLRKPAPLLLHVQVSNQFHILLLTSHKSDVQVAAHRDKFL